MLHLVPLAEVTHTLSGSWASTDASSKVHIPLGEIVTVTGAVEAQWVRVDGELRFADGATLTAEDIVVTGRLEVGTAANPISADIIIRTEADIDLNRDPEMVGRGLVSMGTVEMHGHPKTAWTRETDGALQGDIDIWVEDATGWQVGDTIVIAGTKWDGWKWGGSGMVLQPHQNEIRTIAAINGLQITLDISLDFDHLTPRGDLRTVVANYTRSVTIRSSDPSVWHRRGHTMTMTPFWDTRYVAFEGLGRTNKELDSALPSQMIGQPVTASRKGRYAVHAHHTDFLVHDCAIWGSPGWGLVHHDGHGDIRRNVAYDCVGAAFVAEAGSETGVWEDNVATYSKGGLGGWENPKNGTGNSIPGNFDFGRTGDGFWFQGRLVEASGNVACSVNTGFVYFHRGPEGEEAFKRVDSADFDFPEALHFDPDIKANRPSIRHFRDNEVFASREAVLVAKDNPHQNHDVHTHMKGVKGWEIQYGATFEYTDHYTVEDFDLIAKTPSQFSNPQQGIVVGTNTTDFTLVNPKVDGFEEGIIFTRHFAGTFGDNGTLFTVVNPTLTNITATQMSGEDRVLPALQNNAFAVDVGQLVYNGTCPISGTKTDSIGTDPMPIGTDDYGLDGHDFDRWMADSGWWDGTDGKRYFTLRAYYTDRGTGEVYEVLHAVEIAAGVSVPGSSTGTRNPADYPTAPLLVTDPVDPPAPDPDPEPDPDPDPGDCDCTCPACQAVKDERDQLLLGVAALEAANQSLNADNAAQAATITGLETQVQNLTTTVNTLNGQITTLTAQVASITAERDAAQAQVSALNTTIATLTAQRDAAQAALAPYEQALVSIRDTANGVLP